jgi:hypothetical protein
MRFSFLLILTLIIGCTSNNNDGLGPENSITTESGLEYYYLKKGDGPFVQKGSIVDTKLSLLVEDELIWTSYEAEDSLFTFIAGVSGVISGFEEMAFLMREGDNVVASLPYDIAYGEEGAGDDIPPYATLVYDRYEIVSVSEPKKVISDTLSNVFQESGTDGVISTFAEIMNSEMADDYHSDLTLLQSFYAELRDNEQYEELEELAEYFITQASNDFEKTLTSYYVIVSIEDREEYDRAIEVTNRFLDEFPDDQWFQARLERLTEAKAGN